MTATSLSVAVEGWSDESVVTRLARDHGLNVSAVYGKRGKDHLDQSLAGFNEAAKYANWLVVRDLDRDADCATALVRRLLPRPSPRMTFRVAVRAIEAWLLADVDGIVSFFGVARQHVPHEPETLEDPKAALVDVARRSRIRSIRDDMVPGVDSTARVGPGYVGRVVDFAGTAWSWRRAAARSESLRRCAQRIAAAR